MARRLALLCGLAAGSLAAQSGSPTFRPVEIRREKVTTASVLVTLTALRDLATVDLNLSGATAELRAGELKPDAPERTLTGLKAGQKPQLAGEITTASGQSGQLVISAGSPEMRAAVPFHNQKGQLRLGKASGVGPLAVAARPTSQTVGEGYVVRGDMTVALKAVSKIRQEGMAVTVAAEGVTLLESGAPTAPPRSGNEIAKGITFVARDGQRGRIVTQVSGKTEDGKDYVRRSYLYVLAAPARLYTSASGFVDLEVQRLKGDLEVRRISQEQFDSAMIGVLSGAAERGGVK